MGNTSLFKIIEKLKTDQGPQTLRELSTVLRTYIEEDTWVPMPVIQDEKGYRFYFSEERGLPFALMYSDEAEVKSQVTISITGIRKILEPIFANPEIGGILIDPDTTSLCFEKGFLLKCIMHGYLQPQDNGGCPNKDWGLGIPDYTEEDLMTDGELLNFAMHTILDNDKKLSDYSLASASDNTEANVNLIFEKEGRFAFVLVKGYCAEEEPVLNDEEKRKLLEYGELFNADCYYAPVGFRSSSDLIRFEKCIALKGDGFYANYQGLKMVE